jgi:ArsR family transcriptional regulator, arsenate/arsenite/antimonite-responsive transcriptional repressor
MPYRNQCQAPIPHRALWYLTATDYFDNTRNMKIDDAVTALSGLAQETRLSIYRLLVQAGPDGLAAGRIGEKLKVPGATMSFHLKELNRAGLISSRQERQFIYYAADFDRMAELMAFLTENCCHGMPEKCLSTVAAALGTCCPPTLKSTKRKRSRS